jgi:hypothetical protein
MLYGETLWGDSFEKKFHNFEVAFLVQISEILQVLFYKIEILFCVTGDEGIKRLQVT